LAAGVAFFVAFARRQRIAANPLILPSLLKNRGFTAGMLVGLFYFAAIAGLAYVVSLFLQTALHRTPGQAALGLSPLMVGIIIASFASRPAATILGRKLVFIGFALTVVGAAWMWTSVHVGGVSISQ
jgi:Na+/melibiose symporter-like transporter